MVGTSSLTFSTTHGGCSPDALVNLVALLRMNLFTHRDLMVWIEQPFAAPPDPGDTPASPQASLAFG